MSERNHSNDTVAANITPRRRGWTPLFAGTAAAGIGAAVLFQFFRAETAQSQTQPAAGSKQPAQAAPQKQVLARVNNQPIYWDAVARETVNRYGSEVLDNLINRLLIQQECDRQGITVTKEEVNHEVQSIAKKFNLPV